MIELVQAERERLVRHFQESEQRLEQLQRECQMLNQQLLTLAGGITAYDELIRKLQDHDPTE